VSRTPALPLSQAAALRRRCRALLDAHRRRARAAGVTLAYGPEELLALCRESVCCDYCRAPLAGDFSLDHARPVARGGSHALSNLVACCRTCNVRKGALLASEYRQLLALLASWPPAAQEDVRRRLMSGNALYARNRRKKT
jgi:5-methylcytosine-specific restriction endonuclease McrA